MQILPWILTGLFASVACLVTGAREGLAGLSLAGALVFALALSASSLQVNARWRRHAATGGEGTPGNVMSALAADNADLMAIGYAWGAFAMVSVYTLTGLKWQHGWQYGAGMLVISALLSGYAWLVRGRAAGLARPAALRAANWLTVLQAAAAAAGLGFLAGSGKLMSTRPDWAANQIFLGGGLAIIALSTIAVLARRSIADTRRRPSI